MDIIEYRDYCLSLPLTEETTPFDEDTLVYKVAGKMYAYTSISKFEWVALKCDPDEAVDLRERYSEICGAPHMNKRHWIGLDMNGGLTDKFIRKLILDSYKLVVAGLPKVKKAEVTAAIEYVGGLPE